MYPFIFILTSFGIRFTSVKEKRQMSSSTIEYYTYVSEQIMVYLGLFCLVAGVVGNIFNLIVFLSLKTFRNNTCAFYLTITAIVDIGQLLTGLLTRITITGFDNDITLSSLFYCKFRAYFYQFFSGTSISCMCAAAINQYLCTCSNPRWQQWSKIKINYGAAIGIIIFWLLHGIPYLIYNNLIPLPGGLACAYSNEVFDQYAVYGFTAFLTGFFPMIINGTFAFLAHRNIQQIERRALPAVHQELDKQMTAIVLVQFIYHTISTLPYIIVSIISYNPTLNADPLIEARIEIASSVTIFILYMNYAVPFYMYIFVSPRFRRQFIYAFFQVCINRWRQRIRVINQVTPRPSNPNIRTNDH